MKRFAWTGAALLALTFAALALHIPGADTVGTPGLKVVFVGVLAACVVVYFVAVRLSLLASAPPARGAVWVVLGVALALRVPLVIAPPFLSSDVYRYVWDGRVQVAGINPYRYVPADPALAALRDDAIFPHINRADTAPTIYPPAAQMIFAAVGLVAQTPWAMKAAMVGFEALMLLCLGRLLARSGLPAHRLLIAAWNPLGVWAFAGNGHVDAAAMGLLAAALLLRVRGRTAAAGVALAAAALVKFLPIVIAPALWRAGAGRRGAVAAIVTIVVLYTCYIGAGWGVLGFLPGYRAEEGLDSGQGVWLLAGLSHLVPVPGCAGAAYTVAVAIGLAALGWHIMRRVRAPVGTPADARAVCADAGLLMAAVTVAISPHYPWYFAWLALPATIVPAPALLWLAASPVLLYLDPMHERFFWPCVVYLPALAMAAAQFRARRGDPAPMPAVTGSS